MSIVKWLLYNVGITKDFNKRNKSLSYGCEFFKIKHSW